MPAANGRRPITFNSLPIYRALHARARPGRSPGQVASQDLAAYYALIEQALADPTRAGALLLRAARLDAAERAAILVAQGAKEGDALRSVGLVKE